MQAWDVPVEFLSVIVMSKGSKTIRSRSLKILPDIIPNEKCDQKTIPIMASGPSYIDIIREFPNLQGLRV